MNQFLFGLPTVALVTLLAWSVAPCRSAEQLQASPELTAAEQTLVRLLAEQALKEHGFVKGKVFLTKAEGFLDRANNSRFALVQHYRYEGDLTLQTRINLDRKEVIGIEALPHCPTPISPEELEQAKKLARADRVVKRALVRHKGPIEVDAQLYFTILPEAPTYHHRMVRLLFRQGRNYLLYVPAAEVDLTAGTVRADPTNKGHNRPQNESFRPSKE